MRVLLKGCPDVRARTGLRLRFSGADPLAVGVRLARHGVSNEGIDVLGFLPQEELTRELLAAKVLAAPSMGQESFGMVLTRAFACAVPAVASDIPGYRAVMTEVTRILVAPGDVEALAEGLIGLLWHGPARQAVGESARRLAIERYSWGTIAERLEQIYREVAA